MAPSLTLFILVGYFAMLIAISLLTSKRSDQDTFFTGNRDNPWWLIAFGMIGSTISGVTFISVPGNVGSANFSYFQVVLGYLLGYLAIATILMPMYYRLQLISIYQYLEQRFGFWSYKTGAVFFLLSRLVGASLRLYLAAMVLQIFIFDEWKVPFAVTVLLSVALIYLYTFRAGIKTIVWTDTLQTVFLLSGVIVSIYLISQRMNLGLGEVLQEVRSSELSSVFVWDWAKPSYFWKHFVGGAFIAITMTGLDQEMMQKNLSCRSLRDAQKNMFAFTITLFFANLLFLGLGVLLYRYGEQSGIIEVARSNGFQLLFKNAETGVMEAIRTDQYFPKLAFGYLGPAAALAFILGVIAATYASADAALTGLTTSFCVDILGFQQRSDETRKRQIRMGVHLALSLAMIVVILAFHALNNAAVINQVLDIAGYTYGPLLGLYAFGLFTRRSIRDAWTPLVCVSAAVISYALKRQGIGAYQFGFEIVLLNGILTAAGLWAISRKEEKTENQGSTAVA
ncbi:MAG: sodium:solute symporter [Bacteroidetes bacterium]|nr:MAG: sodium:solute symporter [Bacteroidota bacterium]